MAGKITGYDGSGYPIYDHFGTNAPDIAGMLRGWKERFQGIRGNPTPPMSAPVGQAPPQGPPAPPTPSPQVSGAPAPATAGPPGASAAPSAPPPPSQAAAMGRISQAMQGPPEPTQGPPESPSSPSIFEDMDPLVIEQILQLGDKERQLMFSEKMRDRESPQGRTVSNGRMYVAASPFEHAATAFGKFRGKRQADKIGQDQIAGRTRILDILKKQ